ncbi:MAG: tetratricopeptide repeat protein, partial [Deltaproteobacteria bacterium]|nr:tetratricopeptide repeat protein [Deltaproteobacteria bacterium]
PPAAAPSPARPDPKLPPAQAPAPQAQVPPAPPAKGTEVRVEPPAPDYPRLYSEAIARTKEAISRGAGKDALPLWKALEGSPMGTDAIFHQGVLLHRAGDVDGAVTRYRRITDTAPVFEPAAANLLGIHLLRGDLQPARALIDRLWPPGLTAVPDMLPELQSNIAACLVELGDYDRAALLFLAMRAKGAHTPSLLWNMAVLSYRKGDLPTARRLTAGTPPEVANLWPVVASRFAWDREAGKVPSMEGVPSAERRMAALAGNLAAFEEHRKGNIAGALRILGELGEEKRSFAEILNNLGLLEMEQGKWKEARASLERAVREKPGMAEGWLNLGIFREVYEGNSTEALDCYRRYVSLNGSRKDEVGKWVDWLQKSASPRQ